MDNKRIYFHGGIPIFMSPGRQQNMTTLEDLLFSGAFKSDEEQDSFKENEEPFDKKKLSNNINSNEKKENEYEVKGDDTKSESGESTSVGEDIRVDPNYSWLRELKFEDKKRIIDVTDRFVEKEEEKTKSASNNDTNNRNSNERNEKNVTIEVKYEETNNKSKENKSIEKQDSEIVNNNNNNESVNENDMNSKSKNETLQDAISIDSSINEANEDDDDDDEKLLQEQLTNLLTKKNYNENYSSVDVNNVDSDNEKRNKKDGDEEEEDGELLKTATFKLLSPFNAQLFSQSSSSDENNSSENDERKKTITKTKPKDKRKTTTIVYDDFDDYDEEDDFNIKDLQKKYKKLIESNLLNVDEESKTNDVSNEITTDDEVLSKSEDYENKKVTDKIDFANKLYIIENSEAKKSSEKENKQETAHKKFSKSFEISLSDLDERIDRLNNEIKFKKGKNSVDNTKPSNNNNRNNDTSNVKINGADNLKHVNNNNNTENKTLKENKKENGENVYDIKIEIEKTSKDFQPPPTPVHQPKPHIIKIVQEQQSQQTQSPPQPQQQKQQQPQVNNNNQIVIETLKQEWSKEFEKLENNYRLKLEEQQRKHEEKLKVLYDEIQDSIKTKQLSENSSSMNTSPKQQPQSVQQPSQPQQQQQQPLQQNQQINNLNSTRTINKDVIENFSFSSSSFLNDSSTSTLKTPGQYSMENINIKSSTSREQKVPITNKTDYFMNNKSLNNSFSNDSNYMSNLRLTLKTKHSKHIQDLKAYYEQEIDELKRELLRAQNKLTTISSSNPNTPRSVDSSLISNTEILDLKNQNLILKKKLCDMEQSLEHSRKENYELKSQLNSFKNELYNKDDKLQKLDSKCADLEMQLSKSTKASEQQIRDITLEKRSFAKKCQEFDELRKNLKASEDRCKDLEIELTEKETENTNLKTKITKLESDIARTDYEYQKLRHRYNGTNNSTLLSQTINSENNQPKQQIIPIQINRSSNQYKSSPVINAASSTNFQSTANTSTTVTPTPTLPMSPSPHQNNYGKTSKSPNLNSSGYLSQMSGNSSSQPSLQQKENSNTYYKMKSYAYQAQQKYLDESDDSDTPFYTTNLLQLSPEKHIEYVERLENEFDKLMKRKQYLDSQLTRLPYKVTNTSTHAIRHTLENEIGTVEKQLASVKLELRKLNIIKTTH